MCTMAINNQFNGIELTFSEKPAEEIREAMKAAGFRWHKQKKLWYAKNTAERMTLAEKLSGQQEPTGTAATGDTAPAPAAAAAPVSKFGIKVGDILEGSWGYSMTIAELYKVTKIVSPCRIEIVEIGADLIDADRGGGERLMPNPEKIVGDPVVKTVQADRYSREENAFYVKINDSCRLRPWDGRPVYQNTWD